MPASPITYRIQPVNPHAHLFAVSVTVSRPDPSGQVFTLPAWIPGSYMIREFARNIVSIRAEAGGRAVLLTKRDKHTWQAPPLKEADGPLVVHCEVYAWDLSVRAAHLDASHGFFNGTSVFLRVEGQEHAPCLLEVLPPDGEAYADWKMITALREARDPHAGKGARLTRRHAFGWYRADNYDELVDHPVEMGTFALVSFKVHGVLHEMAFTGIAPNLDLERIARDLKPVCEAQAELFAGKGEAPRVPCGRYVFMTTITADGYGGLEHRASTALICGRNDLPVKGRAEQGEGYRTFLGLCSHEYFHTWNVKRIKPAAFAPYDLKQEGYTRLLWLFEGFTSYYDDLMLVRSRVITPAQYLDLLQKNLNGVLRTAGRTRQSVAESSFDAWTKYYRQDENAPNAIVSYYAKGALVALGLDLKLRAISRGRCSLDDVMRLLWQRYGRRWYEGPEQQGAQGRDWPGVPEDALPALIIEAAGRHADAEFKRWLQHYMAGCVEGTQDVPLAELLPAFGVEVEASAGATRNAAKTGKTLTAAAKAAARPALGIRTGAEGGWLKVTQVHDGGAAQAAGLAAGDLLAALGGLRVKPDTLDKVLSRFAAGETVEVLAFRQDALLRLPLILKSEPATPCTLKLVARPVAHLRALQAGWIGAD